MTALVRCSVRLVVATFALHGCVASGAGGNLDETTRGGNGSNFPARGSDAEIAPGFGTLRQDDITLTIESHDLQIKVTPMAESVIRLTAPDTYERLTSLAHAHATRARERTGLQEPELFLVSVFSNAPNVFFEPEDLTVVSHGRRFRPVAIQAVTPGWESQRLEQRQTRIAVYVFEPGVDLQTDLQVEFRMVRDNGWSRIIPRLQAERARVRARGGEERY